jgi:pimeloyl-ACP methyl ester carboxylesterase
MSAANKRTIIRTRLTIAGIRAALLAVSLFSSRLGGALAGKLFFTPHRGSERGPASSASGFRLQCDDREIQIWYWGNPQTQPRVVLAHGWSGSPRQFEALIPALRTAGFSVIAFDQPAHGSSSGRRTSLVDFKRVLGQIVKHFGGVEAVIAHSLGALACAHALAEGARVRRAILLAPVADPYAVTKRYARALWLPERARKQMQRMLEVRTGVAFADLHAARIAPRLGVPALIVHDLQDRAVPWGDGELFAHRWPGAQLITTSGLGHNRILREPEVIAQMVAFLQGRRVGRPVIGSLELEAA